MKDLFAPTGRWGKRPSIADRIEIGDCWEWTGGRFTRGYGQIDINAKPQLVHRVVWEALVGPIPSKMTIDHMCRNKICCNPDHLRIVTRTKNAKMVRSSPKAVCSKGHRLIGHNLYISPEGSRSCRECRHKRAKAFYQREKDTK